MIHCSYRIGNRALKAEIAHFESKVRLRQFLGLQHRAQQRTRWCRAASAGMSYTSYDYEVFGKVQGVFFRQSTVEEAKKLGVVGWVKNTSEGTVKGQVQGKQDAAAKMQTFLKEKGSSQSHIDKCDIRNEKEVQKLDFSSFEER